MVPALHGPEDKSKNGMRRLCSSFAGGEEKRYFAPMYDVQGGGPAGDQSSRDGGVVLNHKVPGNIAPRVGSSRWFPGEFVK